MGECVGRQEARPPGRQEGIRYGHQYANASTLGKTLCSRISYIMCTYCRTPQNIAGYLPPDINVCLVGLTLSCIGFPPLSLNISLVPSLALALSLSLSLPRSLSTLTGLLCAARLIRLTLHSSLPPRQAEIGRAHV